MSKLPKKTNFSEFGTMLTDPQKKSVSQFKASHCKYIEGSDLASRMGNIFVIDGNTESLKQVSDLLMGEGYVVQTFSDSLTVLEEAIAAPPELILLDTSLPDIDGEQLCSALKSHPATQNVPLLFISNSNDVDHKIRAFELGVNDYIAKPFEVLEVLVRVKNHLRICTLYRQLTEQNHLLKAEIDRRKQAEERSKRAEEKFRKAFYSSPNPSTITLLDGGRHIEVNDCFCRITGYTAAEIVGKNAIELNLWVSLSDRENVFELIRRDRRIKNHEFEFRTKSGAIRTAILSCEIIWINGEECLLSLSNDITERKQAESQLQIANNTLQRLADFDSLTQIANRRRFDTYLKYHLEKAFKNKNYLSMFLCDVDHFKAYNDYYGHLQGDTCLMQLAKIFRSSLKESTDFVARYGGEEFAIILPGRSQEEATVKIQTVWQAIQDAHIPHADSETIPYVTVSFGGVTITPDHDMTTPRQLIGKADKALYRAKQEGRNRIVFSNWV